MTPERMRAGHRSASDGGVPRLLRRWTVDCCFGGGELATRPKVGDTVGWDSSGGHSTGKVVKKQTTPTKVKGRKVAASKDDSRYIVKSGKSGKEAAHKASALKKG
jgi:DUF2945 family protein